MQGALRDLFRHRVSWLKMLEAGVAMEAEGLEESLRVLRLLVVNLLRLFVKDSRFCEMEGKEMGKQV